ncbi:elongation factor P hydroxylase [Bisgaard Taxon 10/6]|uniref:elongation factor P hydroxylase n=1 Tax=Exercitatus varius TaxID=67857 RepID=UPI00294AB8E8|nr:elongation factor P hydroxylase [Exercitatus varius]MDG2914991.1 elongation factor P hydroxylase [Exercitatus varius]MDG2916691.1 elongation factor P hydroxylase [Exercitatus varius]MDG2951321.1 elongation factor P hydroxylase [Exercitatus varius]MDG2955432.1 elongation factor P hydroxylase [Exercitatus varius]MDG2963712.1 elongation factor P hydroxylase [Exercitatus varius]
MQQNSETHTLDDIIAIFNGCFEKEFNTKLVKGGDEPIYIPAEHKTPGYDVLPYHAIYFARGFYSSALHEISHWLVAGTERRKLEDFGYWYEPDGRSPERQREFEKVEVKPQAIEWILATAANFRYFASADNLNGNPGDIAPFKQAVYAQVKTYAEKGLPQRAEKLRRALSEFYGTEDGINLAKFDISRI